MKAAFGTLLMSVVLVGAGTAAFAEPVSGQSSCYRAEFGRTAAKVGRAAIQAMELQWFTATDQILDGNGSPKADVGGADGATVGVLLKRRGYGEPELFSALVTIRLEGEPRGLDHEKGGASALCIREPGGHFFCAAGCSGGSFTIRGDGRSHVRLVNDQGGFTLNACDTARPRLRLDPQRRRGFRLRRDGYDTCGDL